MSVDLGKARTGIAVCDELESFAFPKTVITEYNTEKLVEKMRQKNITPFIWSGQYSDYSSGILIINSPSLE